MWPIERIVRAADLAHALGQDVDAGLDLRRLLVEQQVVVAEMRPADVPMEILGLHIERKRVSQQPVERLRDLLDGFVRQIGRRVQARGRFARFELSHLLLVTGCTSRMVETSGDDGSMARQPHALMTRSTPERNRSSGRAHCASHTHDSHKVYYGIFWYGRYPCTEGFSGFLESTGATRESSGQRIRRRRSRSSGRRRPARHWPAAGCAVRRSRGRCAGWSGSRAAGLSRSIQSSASATLRWLGCGLSRSASTIQTSRPSSAATLSGRQAAEVAGIGQAAEAEAERGDVAVLLEDGQRGDRAALPLDRDRSGTASMRCSRTIGGYSLPGGVAKQ